MIVHQLLHGYSQGHTLLASSIKLSSAKDTNMIMTISDWTEYKSPLGDDSSYLTAYPLSDSDYYAIAKTWYADEMERPGCVWTHTLLFNIHDLSHNVDIRLLQSYFKRPIKSEYDSYSKDFVIDDNSVLGTPCGFFKTKLPLQYVSDVYKVLIDKQTVVLSIVNSSLFYQELILSIIRHMPPLMLKDISFCSGCASTRRINGNPMNLQFSSSMRDDKTPIFKITQNCDWVDYIAKSIIDEKKDIPTLLSIYSEEIQSIGNLKSIISIFGIVDKLPLKNEDVNIFIEFIRVVSEGFPKPDDGLQLKTRLLNKSASRAFCDEIAFIYEMGVTKYFSSFDYGCFNYTERIIDLYKEDSLKYIELLEMLINNSSSLNSFGESIIINSANILSSVDIAYIVDNKWSIFMCLVSIDNSLFNNKAWISVCDNNFKNALKIFDKNLPEIFDYWSMLTDKILTTNSSVSTKTIKRLKSVINTIGISVLDFVASGSNTNICNSIIEETINEDVVLLWLDKAATINQQTAKLIMKTVSPLSAKIKSHGSQIWQMFYRLNSEDATLQYYIYLFILSYNWKFDKIAFSYHVKAFYPIHRALADNQISDNQLYTIEKFTKPLVFWNEWDKCKKLRNGLVDRLIEEGYKEELLYNITPNLDLNEKLVKIYRKKQ